ncbi:MAG: Clp protease N-terminal domain-containing protein [Actinomycetota bacterium]
MRLRSGIRDVKTIGALLTGAEREARDVGIAEPGAEHLLLAAFDLPDGTARRAFERLGADPEGFRRALVAVREDVSRSAGIAAEADGDLDVEMPPARGVYRMSPSGRAAFDDAGAMARADRSVGLTGAHVVLAVARMDHGTTARALRHLGIDRDELIAAAQGEIDHARDAGEGDR